MKYHEAVERIEFEIERVKRRLESKDYDEYWSGYLSGLHQVLAWLPIEREPRAARPGKKGAGKG